MNMELIPLHKAIIIEYTEKIKYRFNNHKNDIQTELNEYIVFHVSINLDIENRTLYNTTSTSYIEYKEYQATIYNSIAIISFHY